MTRVGAQFHLSRADFDYLRRLVSDYTGIRLAENKYDMFYSRLVRRVRQLGLDGFEDYVALIRSGHPEEFVELVNAITTGLTDFFRESHHFDYLAGPFLLELRARGPGGIRIWSAGCSSGEEPYSIAMTLLEALDGDTTWPVHILATDLDTQALQKGRDGIYPYERVAGLAPARQRRWFQRGRGTRAGQVRVKPEPRALVAFHKLNLMEDWPIRPGLEAIFCRNVMIYFDPETKRRLLNRFHETLAPGGLLFIGHSESLIGLSDHFTAVGRTTYRRR